MLNNQQINKVLKKFDRFVSSLEAHIFEKVDELSSVFYFETEESLNSVPAVDFKPVTGSEIFGGEGKYCWFRSSYIVPPEQSGKMLYIMPHIGGYEGLLFVNGRPYGNFASKILIESHGNHYCNLLTPASEAGQKLEIGIEYYAGHYIPGNAPLGNDERGDFTYKYNGIDICVKNREVSEFYFDLKTISESLKVLPETSFRKAKLINAVIEIYNNVYTSTEDTDFNENLEALRKLSPLIKSILSDRNGDSAPEAAVIGHSHMDTAWLWHVGETIKKCARTYSGQLSLMREYPEYKFIQSSSCHSNMIRENYPELFEEIVKAVKEKRYEPNGGVWVECDCNITGGESLIRQFLWGQRFTGKYFGYTSNCFWLPDTFGYSAAIPQIMKGCCVDYFLTTKISWNDTNKFPYDTFYWKGIDGTEVFTHFNTTHHFPSPLDVHENIEEGIMQKGVTNKRLLAYGYGDGGGGPQFEMIEMARRLTDLEGNAKLHHEFAGDFMKELERDAKNPNVYKGELYLELHRGTLTNQHTIKRNNRKAEVALHNLEFLTAADAFNKKSVCTQEKINPLYEILLKNQFHDILPGTCINRAHEESRQETFGLLRKAAEETEKIISGEENNLITLTNTLSFERNDTLFIESGKDTYIKGDYSQQRYTDSDGKDILIVAGIKIPAFSSLTLELSSYSKNSEKIFIKDGKSLETPFYTVIFDDNMTIKSLFDKRAGRELVSGENFNTFLVAEDIPENWDNWDIDADIENKFRNASCLVSSETVSEGECAFIIRNIYRITDKSSVVQDMIFFRDSAEIRFDTAIDWNDDHRFLKTSFDTGLNCDFARHEIQFGNVKRPTTRNNSVEQAKFEVVNHRYTDISETRYGAAVLNDCKYGISTKGGSMRLSLHKGGTHPDYKGDKDGIHRCVYSFLPHMGDFSAENVIKPAYMLNYPPVAAKGSKNCSLPISVDADNCIIETVKPCEDSEKAFIIRIYEAEGAYTNAVLTLPSGIKKAVFTNMLEEETGEQAASSYMRLVFRPFEIKTIKIYY